MDESREQQLQEALWEQVIAQVETELAKKYNSPEGVDIEWLLRIVFRGFGSVEALRGKRILDLGCGSMTGGEHLGEHLGEHMKEFEPWFCRAIHELGANAVGVDGGCSPDEEFEFHHLDLVDPGALRIFKDHSFDAIHSRGLVDSPAFADSLVKAEKFRQGFLPKLGAEIRRMLKPEGKLLMMVTSTNDDVRKQLGISDLPSIYKKGL